MERWLSKSRVLLGLSAVLLIAALNRQDPMVYGMFLFLAVVSFLGFALPWLSLRSMSVRVEASGDLEVTEGSDCDLNILVERRLPWPAFMVELETEWEWASNRLVLSQTIPIIRAGHAPKLDRLVRFSCRGDYELIEVRVASGFPLGLMRAQHTLARPNIHLRVLPHAQPVQWPLPWGIADDPLGELSTRRMGQSFELGMLRPYQDGESVGRVSWRASARVGELVIQHFQQSGSIRLRVVAEHPREPDFGVFDSAGEQVLRLVVGVADVAVAAGVRLLVDIDKSSLPLRDPILVRRALAQLPPATSTVFHSIARAARQSAIGEQIAVVVSSTCPAEPLVNALTQQIPRGVAVVVLIALAKTRKEKDVIQGQTLHGALTRAGFTVWMEAP